MQANSETVRLRSWPLLNVAATRAKRVLYVVGNRTEWQFVDVFAVAAQVFQPRSAADWLGLAKTAPTQ